MYALYKQYRATKLNLLIAGNWMLVAVHKLGAKNAAKSYLDHVSSNGSKEANPILKQLCKVYGMSSDWISDEEGGVEDYERNIRKLANAMSHNLRQFELATEEETTAEIDRILKSHSRRT